MIIFTPLVLSGGGYAASAGADASGLMTLIGKQVPVSISHIMMTNKEMRVFVTIQSGRTFQLQLEHLEALSDVAILFLILIMMSATTQVITITIIVNITMPIITTIINHHQSHNTIVITITSDQIASNAATTSMLVPVIKTLAIKLQVTLTWFLFDPLNPVI